MGIRGAPIREPSMQVLLLSCLVAAAAGQYAVVRPVVYATQPAVLRTVPVVRTVPAAVPVPTYVYQPSKEVLRVQEAAKKQSAYAAEKLAADVEAVNNFKVENAAGLDYQYTGPNYNNIAVQFGGSEYLDPATFAYQYKPEEQYQYDIENPKPFKYTGPAANFEYKYENNNNQY